MVQFRLPVRHVGEYDSDPADRGRWPTTLAPVRQLLDDGLDFGAATVFVGENGSGKSTIVEGIASAYGLSMEGGSTGAMLANRPSESSLGDHLRIARDPGATHRGYFIRAETMHGLFTYLEENPSMHGPNTVFHELSHGESFLEIMVERFRGPGLWVLDEPESALSFAGCLALVGLLKETVARGDSQVILSTHSPLLAALPGAQIYEVGGWGIRAAEWDDLDLVTNWKLFLDAPQRYLRHL